MNETTTTQSNKLTAKALHMTKLQQMQSVKTMMEHDLTDLDRLYHRINDALNADYRAARAARLNRIGAIEEAIQVLAQHPDVSAVMDQCMRAEDACALFAQHGEQPELEPYAAAVRTFGMANARAATPPRTPPEKPKPFDGLQKVISDSEIASDARQFNHENRYWLAQQLNVQLANAGFADRVNFDNDGNLIVMTDEQKQMLTAPLPINEKPFGPGKSTLPPSEKVPAPNGE